MTDTELVVTTPHAFSVRGVPTSPVPVRVADAAVILVPVPGGQGPRGQAGTGAQVFGETPAGVQNGVNDVFTLANAYQAGSTAVYRNGLREHKGVGYLETGAAVITFTTAPLADDDITVDYLVQ